MPPLYPPYPPRLDPSEEDRLAAIGRHSQDALDLVLVLAQFSNGAVPLSLLRCGTRKQMRFGRDGEWCFEPPQRSGVPAGIVSLVQDKNRFYEAVAHLAEPRVAGLIRTGRDGGEHGEDGGDDHDADVVLSPDVHRLARERLVREAGRKYAFETGLRIVSHAFPRRIFQDPSDPTGRAFLPQVDHHCGLLAAALGRHEDISSSVAATAVSLFTSAVSFSQIGACERLVCVSEELMLKVDPTDGSPAGGATADFDFLAAYLAELSGRILPRIGRPAEGIDALLQFVWNRPETELFGDPAAASAEQRQPNRLANAMHGRVFVLLAECLLEAGRAREAERYLASWHRFDPPSLVETIVGESKERGLINVLIEMGEWARASRVLDELDVEPETKEFQRECVALRREAQF